MLRHACIRVPLSMAAVNAQGLVTDPQLHTALLDMLDALTRSLAAPAPRQSPSWQVYSSVYPVIQRRENPTVHNWPAQK